MKKQIRNEIKANIDHLSEKQINQKSKVIQQCVLDLEIIQQAKIVGIFHSTTQEVQTKTIINTLLDKQKKIALPKITGQHLTFHAITTLNNLKENSFGILEPLQSDAIIKPNDIDVLIIPCLAVDAFGNRLGRGRGYYDRYLKAATKPVRLCLAFDCQLLPQVPTEKHDEQIDFIVTESKTIDVKQASNKFLYGQPIAQKIIENTKNLIQKQKIIASLSVILVGSDPASHLYVQKKKETCKKAGIACTILIFDADIDQETVITTIKKLNSNNSVTGIMVQLPLPKHLDRDTIVNTITIEKDVDGLTKASRKLLAQGDETHACCTPKGIIELLNHYNISLKNKTIGIVGCGYLVGGPLALMLKNRNAQFFVCDKNTKNIKSKTRTADILICATGAAHLINNDYIKPGAIVIDAGTAKLNNKTVGDVDTEAVLSKTAKITPVPGGVGPMTIAMLVENIMKAYEKQQTLSKPINNIAIVTSTSSWFIPYAQQLETDLSKTFTSARLFTRYEDINNQPDVVFILSYFKLIKKEELKKHPHNLVVHESDLQNGKGWAPLFWQVLEGTNNIPVTLFEANEDVDAGDIFFRDSINLQGTELHDEIRHKQALKTMDICEIFLKNHHTLTPQKQVSVATTYARRTPKDSELDINKPLKELFNQLRIASNKDYPAFFYYNGEKYTLKIHRD